MQSCASNYGFVAFNGHGMDKTIEVVAVNDYGLDKITEVSM